MTRKKIAVVLSGCGNKDGSEITEAVSLMIGLSTAGAELSFFAPDLEFTPVDFLTNKPLNQTRNVLHESARIVRSQIKDLKALRPQEFDGLALPGGFGAAMHLSNWSSRGANCEVQPDLREVLIQFHAQKRPIAAICIAPAVVAKVLGSQGITLTIGDDKETIAEIQKTGAHHEVCPVEDFISDRDHKLVTTPAYMYGNARVDQVFRGIRGLAKEFIEMA